MQYLLTIWPVAVELRRHLKYVEDANVMVSRVWSIVLACPVSGARCNQQSMRCFSCRVAKCVLLLMLATYMGAHWLLENPLASIVVALVLGSICCAHVEALSPQLSLLA